MAKGIKTGGRLPGTRNKKTEEFREVLERNDFCAATALIEIYRDARKNYESVMKKKSSKLRAGGHIYLKIAKDAVAEIASYAHPKLKATEKTVSGEVGFRIIVEDYKGNNDRNQSVIAAKAKRLPKIG